MTVWVIRGGRQLEFVPEALRTNVVAVRFGLREDLTHASQVHIRGLLQQRDPESKKIDQDASQLWRFKDEIKNGDLVIMPVSYQQSLSGRSSGITNIVLRHRSTTFIHGQLNGSTMSLTTTLLNKIIMVFVQDF